MVPFLLPTMHPTTATATVQDLFASFQQFLIILTHSILYHRQIYPSDSFALTRFYDVAVQRNRHPGVCAWIQEMVEASIEMIQKVSMLYYKRRNRLNMKSSIVSVKCL